MLRLPLLVSLVFCFFAVCAICGDSARATEPNSVVGSAQIGIAYEPPSNTRYTAIYDATKRLQVLERLQKFLVPLRLPKPIAIRLAQCGAQSVPYQAGGVVTICYEMLQRVVDIASEKAETPAQRVQMIDGTFVLAILHQLAYAIFDVLQVPVWGREFDAADRLSAFILMQFGDEVAVSTILGVARFFESSDETWTGGDFASADSPAPQRFYNFLCIAYGGDPITFAFLAPRPGPSRLARLPERRAARCFGEYEQVRHAFDLRIMPYVDPDEAIRVRATQWLSADELARDDK